MRQFAASVKAEFLPPLKNAGQRFAAVRGVNLMMRAADRREQATGRDSMVGHAAHLISGR